MYSKTEEEKSGIREDYKVLHKNRINENPQSRRKKGTWK